MLRVLTRRLLTLVPLLVLVSLAVFALLFLVPGDPAITLAGENATAQQIHDTRVRLGLTDPVVVQYGRWASKAVRGDLGTSLYNTQPVTEALSSRIPVTLSLTLAAMVFAILLALPAALLAAIRPRSWIDRALTVGTSVGVAVPSFWLGLILIIVFAIKSRLLPPAGYVAFTDNPLQWFRHILLPAVALGTVAAAEAARQLRAALDEVLRSDYVRTAEAKGLRRAVVVGKHALKNAAVPAVTVLGLQLTFLLGGSVIIEQMFGIPGLGALAVTSVESRDLPMIQGIVLIAVMVSVISNTLVDISYGYLNPRVRA